MTKIRAHGSLFSNEQNELLTTASTEDLRKRTYFKIQRGDIL